MILRTRCARGYLLPALLISVLLFVSFISAAAVDTTIGITPSPADPVVGQDVTVTWKLTVQTTSAVTFGPGSPDLSRLITAPGGGNILNDSVSTDEESSPFSSDYSFTANQAGTYTIEGQYAGCPACDPALNASSKSTNLAVNKAGTSTAVAADKSPANYVTGETVTLTATVAAAAPGTGTATGTVTFYADGVPLGSGTLDEASPNTASVSATFNAADSPITITATYNGDTNYNSSSDTLASDLTVNQAATTTAVDSDKYSAVTGETVTLTATVTGSVTTTPTGTVEFFADGSSLGSVSVNASGVATLATSFAAADSPVSISATYSGDANYEDSSDTMTGTITVDQASTTVTITSDLVTDTVVGEPYTVGGTVTPTYANGPHTTAGTVEVTDDGTPVCKCTDTTLTWNIDHWDWSCSLASTTAGSRTITATYLGDTNYSGSSDTDSHTVNKADTTTTVTSDINPSVTGEEVEFTATVAAAAPGSGTPTGTVTFYDGASIGQDNDGSDGWKLKYTFPSAGANTITATYSGDSNYKTSTSSAYTVPTCPPEV